MSKQEKGIFKNPVINEQAKWEIPFVRHKKIGHSFPKGREFLGEEDFISIGDKIKEIKELKKSGKRVITVFNMGASSTTGWTDVSKENKIRKERDEELKSPFFHYKNYADWIRCLAKQDTKLKDVVIESINSATPAWSSLQVGIALELRVNEMIKQGVKPDIVTIYCGNNDSVWDCNREDKDWVGASLFRKIKTYFTKKDDDIITRVSPEDYETNLEKMIDYCRDNEIIPILIKPIRHKEWKSGTRVKGEELERREGKGSSLVYMLLDKSLKIWEKVINLPDSQFRTILLEVAMDYDVIVPRIGDYHRRRLRNVAKRKDVHLIQIKYMLGDIHDYCHPGENACYKYAVKILDKVKDYVFGKIKVQNYEKRKLNPITKGIIGLLKSMSWIVPYYNTNSKIPTDIYPLH